jgi:hypothetical protein
VGGHDLDAPRFSGGRSTNPIGSSWINQIETWFGIITRQSIRRGTFTSVAVLLVGLIAES